MVRESLLVSTGSTSATSTGSTSATSATAMLLTPDASRGPRARLARGSPPTLLDVTTILSGDREAPAVHRVDTTTDDALGTSDMTELVDRLASGEVTPLALREAALERTRRTRDTLNAVVGEIAAGHPELSDSGPLAGIPSAFKDNEAIAGYPTSHGSRATTEIPARHSAPFARMMLGLGLDPVVRTTLPEFGLTASTESIRFGATGNPWDISRSAGGSSGGSAALVAAGAVPIAHANDGGGSIRIPASACGVVGLKASRGRMPNDPDLERLPVRIIAQGVVTRTVRDTALFHALAEQAVPARGLPHIGHVRGPGIRLRVGVVLRGTNGLPLDPEVRAAVQTTADVLDKAGHHVRQAAPPVDDNFARDFLTIWAMLAFTAYRGGRYTVGPGWDRGQVEPLMRELSARMVRFGERVPTALRRLRRLSRDGERSWSDYDVLLTPVTSHPAPPLGYLGPDVDVHEHLVRLIRYCSYTSVQNVTGSPAISLPMGRAGDGMPIGVQLVAPLGMERRLLEVALELESLRPWPTTPGVLGDR